MSRSTYAFALLALAAALAIAGCGGSSSSSGGGAYGGGGSSSDSSAASSESAESSGGAYAPPAKETTSSGGGEAANVSLASVGDLGKVLVNSKGFTLYNFHKDKGTTSSCYGECEAAWPPLLTSGAPTVGNGAQEAMLGTTKRKDGSMQVTYNGHPLYGFVGDKKPGEANGNDISAFGAEWYALMGNGEEPEDS